MIHRIFANKPSFREVRFRPGLNIVLAERTEAATSGDSRNGVGKSTLIEIIHFCFGASADAGKGLRRPELAGWAFSIDFDLRAMRLTATRATSDPGRVVVSDADTSWPVEPRVDSESGERSFSLEQWKALLGWAFFGLWVSPNESLRYRPSFRSLFSYVCRRIPMAYTDPFRHFPQQPKWDSQLHVSFLLGLGWQTAAQWQQIRDEMDGLDALKKAAKLGVVSGFVGTEGELEARRVELEARLQEQQRNIASFKVHPEYERLQTDANRLTEDMQQLNRTAVMLRRKLALYTKNVQEESPPGERELELMYREAGVVLVDSVRRTLKEAQEFHRKLVANRRDYLMDEIARLEGAIQAVEQDIRRRSNDRSELLAVLETHGAFDEFARLSEQMARTRHEHEIATERLREVAEITERRQELKAARVDVERSARRDYNERRVVWSRAVRIFNENSEALYDSPGRLIIDVGETGVEFGVEIERQGSEGIAKMEVFCFDLMIAEHLPSFGISPRLLVHDSVIFDGVDSRQRARALMLAAVRSGAGGFQYICTLNTDMVPTEDLRDDFSIDSYVRLTLSDGDASGSLLGIRF